MFQSKTSRRGHLVREHSSFQTEWQKYTKKWIIDPDYPFSLPNNLYLLLHKNVIYCSSHSYGSFDVWMGIIIN